MQQGTGAIDNYCAQVRSLTSVEPATDTSSLTACKRAAVVIRNGSITLDTKLAVFTVLGTMEPRVVKLFPNITCSCPAKGGCYHVKAAQMAVGLLTYYIAALNVCC